MYEEKSPRHYVLSYLKEDTIKWINRRSQNNSKSIKAHTFPGVARQIHIVLDSINIDAIFNKKCYMNELKDYIDKTISFYRIRIENISADNEEDISHVVSKAENFVNSYAGSDREGTVEFVEFLINTSCPGADLFDAKSKKTRLMSAFNELCSYIRRRRLRIQMGYDFSKSNTTTTATKNNIGQLQRKNSSITKADINGISNNSNLSDVDRLHCMVELFGINHFKSESFEMLQEDFKKRHPHIDKPKHSLFDQLHNFKHNDSEKQKSSSKQSDVMTRKYKEKQSQIVINQRKAEINRARTAKLIMCNNKTDNRNNDDTNDSVAIDNAIWDNNNSNASNNMDSSYSVDSSRTMTSQLTNNITSNNDNNRFDAIIKVNNHSLNDNASVGSIGSYSSIGSNSSIITRTKKKKRRKHKIRVYLNEA